MTRKPPTKAEREWMGRVAALGCAICGSPANVHHIRSGMGMGQRAGHSETIPLCHYHHQGAEGIHTLGTRAWQVKYGYEKDLLDRVRAELGGHFQS